jgi:alkylhydroperoxidase/carboxymuconolactone decarboxylase family protein YurZ
MPQQAEALMPTSPTATTSATDVTGILTAEELEQLRKNYDSAAIVSASMDSIVGAYSGAAGFMDVLSKQFYTDPSQPRSEPGVSSLSFDPAARERILIAVLTIRLGGQGRFLAVHLYWGLMVGLSVQEIADQLLLIGMYVGLPNFTASIATFQTLLKELKACVADGGDSLKSLTILGKMGTWFPTA